MMIMILKKVVLITMFALVGMSGMALELDGKTGATVRAKDTISESHTDNSTSRLRIGGYGEAVMSRNFYSQSFNRYNAPERYKEDGSHGRFDLPHVTFNISYNFGHGWSLGSEVEFEHGGTETAVEIEAEESGEYEAETEKGGEVALEQFWINKSFLQGKINVKAGEIIVPVGYANAYHEPLSFFTCYRPEGESTILPNTWHQLGFSIWGKVSEWRYEMQFLSGLNSESFTAEKFVHQGATSPYEFKVANSYAAAARVDYIQAPGSAFPLARGRKEERVRVGVSAYYGHTFRNSIKDPGASYKDVNGALAIIAADFEVKRWNWIVRGSVDYASLSDADRISEYNKANSTHHKYQDGNPFHNTNIGSNALAYGIEAGYNVFSQIQKLKEKEKLYLFGRFEHYNTMAAGSYKSQYKYCAPYQYVLGVNYHPIKQIVVKVEYAYRFFKKPNNNGLSADSPLYVQPYNNEPSLNLSIAYQGWFM